MEGFFQEAPPSSTTLVGHNGFTGAPDQFVVLGDPEKPDAYGKPLSSYIIMCSTIANL